MKNLVCRLDDFKRFIMAIDSLDVPRLHQLISVALCQGASINAIIECMRLAAYGGYHPWGYGEYDIELAYLVKAIGGPRLLYALNYSLGLPSARSIWRHIKVPELLSSVAAPTSEEVGTNIHAFFGEDVIPEPLPCCGHSVFLDGVSIDEKGSYLHQSKSIVGFCHEHAPIEELCITNIDSIKCVTGAVHGEKPTYHYGKEATVVAIAPFHKNHYNAIPIMVSLTCKAEKGDGFARLLAMIIEAWRDNPDGEAHHGPLWCVGTDGEGTFRMEKFKLLMTHEATIDLAHILAPLPGINLHTGPNGIMINCDPKHIWKCECFSINLQ